MLEDMPENSLFTSDAGFVGYEFWKAIVDAGHDFLVRIGAHVNRITQLGYAREYGHTVYLWPEKAAKKNFPPLVLRLIVIHNGKHPVYLVTSVLSQQRLSDQQAIEMDRYRWGIEVFFRTFKQTFGRTQLRSRAAENAPLEWDGSLVALGSICLLGQRDRVRAGESPSQPRAASAIQAVQTTLREYRVRPESSDETWDSMLEGALLDGYDRPSSKTSRDYPRQKQRKRIASPKITRAQKKQIINAKEIKTMQRKLRSTA